MGLALVGYKEGWGAGMRFHGAQGAGKGDETPFSPWSDREVGAIRPPGEWAKSRPGYRLWGLRQCIRQWRRDRGEGC